VEPSTSGRDIHRGFLKDAARTCITIAACMTPQMGGTLPSTPCKADLSPSESAASHLRTVRTTPRDFISSTRDRAFGLSSPERERVITLRAPRLAIHEVKDTTNFRRTAHVVTVEKRHDGRSERNDRARLSINILTLIQPSVGGIRAT
jgi:hypothetical protein